MSTSPTVSVLRNSTNPAWESGSTGEKGAEKKSKNQFVHNSVSPADPSRQASRLPIKVLKMLTARAGHLLHPEYLQPLPSTPISPIEVRIRGNVCAHGQVKSVDGISLSPLRDSYFSQSGSLTKLKQHFTQKVK